MKLKISREFKIGIFGVAMLAVLYWGINFIKGKDLFSPTRTYYAVYEQVNGLQNSASVTIKGYKVGSVSDISFDPQKSSSIIVEFEINKKYHLPKDSEAKIFSDGFLGGKAIEIQLGQEAEVLQDGDTLQSTAEKDLLEVAGNEFEFLKQRINTVASDISMTMATLNLLINENRPSIQATLANTAALSANLNEVATSEKGSLKSMISNLNSLSKSLSEKSGQIDNIINNFESFSDSLAQSEIPTMISELSATLNQLNTTIKTVNSGEGTVGQLLKDDALYDELLSASTNLSTLLEDIKRHPGRYVNISVFGRRSDE